MLKKGDVKFMKRYYDFKRLFEECLTSAIKIKNLYFKGGQLQFY